MKKQLILSLFFIVIISCTYADYPSFIESLHIYSNYCLNENSQINIAKPDVLQSSFSTALSALEDLRGLARKSKRQGYEGIDKKIVQMQSDVYSQYAYYVLLQPFGVSSDYIGNAMFIKSVDNYIETCGSGIEQLTTTKYVFTNLDANQVRNRAEAIKPRLEDLYVGVRCVQFCYEIYAHKQGYNDVIVALNNIEESLIESIELVTHIIDYGSDDEIYQAVEEFDRFIFWSRILHQAKYNYISANQTELQNIPYAAFKIDEPQDAESAIHIIDDIIGLLNRCKRQL